MLKIKIDDTEFFDERTQTFEKIKGQILSLEHSLVSVYKWESKWHIPFLEKNEKNTEMLIDYVRCMTLTQNVNPIIYKALTNEHIKQINDYIEEPMTATWFSDNQNKRVNREIITAERIYYWMIALNIPFECQKWHLNKLLTLIKVCNAENQPKQKIPKQEWARKQRALNAARNKKYKKH